MFLCVSVAVNAVQVGHEVTWIFGGVLPLPFINRIDLSLVSFASPEALLAAPEASHLMNQLLNAC